MSSDAQPIRTSSFDDAPDSRAARTFEVMLRVPDLSLAVAGDAPVATEDAPQAPAESSSDGRKPREWLEVVQRTTVINQLRRSALFATGVLIVLMGGYFAIRWSKQPDSPSTEGDATQWVGIDDSQWRGFESTPEASSFEGADSPSRAQVDSSESVSLSRRIVVESSPRGTPSFDPLQLGPSEVAIDPTTARLYAEATSSLLNNHSYPITDPGSFRFAHSEALPRKSAENRRTADNNVPSEGHSLPLESRLEGRIEHLPLR